MKKLLLLIIVTILSSACHHASNNKQNKPLLVLAINDVYLASGVDNGKSGGLARVKTLRSQLLADGNDVLLLHAGDFIYPSFDSRIDDGFLMIQAMNLLDGDEKSFDPDMLVVFGNHEFDKTKLKDIPLLQNNLKQSDFAWLDSNIHWKPQGIRSEKLLNYAIKQYGNLKVGVFGFTTDIQHPKYIDSFDGYEQTAKKYVPLLRNQGVDVVIALTHHWLKDDKAMMELDEKYRPDLIIGGHEHTSQILKINGNWIVKADADATTAAVVEVYKEKNQNIKISPNLAVLDNNVEADQMILASVLKNQIINATKYCPNKSLPSDCLEGILGYTKVKLIAAEEEIRKYETNLGNLLADIALDTFAHCGAEVAVLNSGSIRLNQNIPAGSAIRQKHLEGLFPYATNLKLIQIDGKTLKAMLKHDINFWTANGHWLQISGFSFTHNPEQQSFSQVRLNGQKNLIDDDQLIKMVVPNYLIDKNTNHDGYTMIDESMILKCDATGSTMKELFPQYLAKYPAGISPVIDHRICNTTRDKCH
ncbi:MAG: 5'-nucleotidase C-terminal domain-containing protein [Proteobacteria bacterium]|nr:5'-nucleotidase C-terminal domain-containing protein [Pseudomonadota bacterium]